MSKKKFHKEKTLRKETTIERWGDSRIIKAEHVGYDAGYAKALEDTQATLKSTNNQRSYEKELEEFTISKGWELDKDKFFIDESAEEIKHFISWHCEQEYLRGYLKGQKHGYNNAIHDYKTGFLDIKRS